MHHRPFSASQTVSEIGLGCWQLSGTDWGDVDDVAALRIMHAACDGGVTIFDTADVYGGGRSEQLIGRFRQESSHRPFIASKLGRRPLEDGSPLFSKAGFRAAVQRSLRHLGTDALDLVQLHCIPRERLADPETWGWLEDLRQEGLIRFYGASVETVDEGLLCLRQPGCRSLQVICSILRQVPTERLFPEAARKGVAVIVRLPLASGLLSGRMTRERVFLPGDHRSYNRDGAAFHVGETFAGLGFENGLVVAEGLRPLVPSGLTMAQMALRWCLDHPEVTTIIPGATRPAQVADNLRAGTLAPLPPHLHVALADYERQTVRPLVRGAV